MSSTRTQIYLTAEQRSRLNELARKRESSMAMLVREAVDLYLESEGPDPTEALASTFGKAPGMDVPSRNEWHRG